MALNAFLPAGVLLPMMITSAVSAEDRATPPPPHAAALPAGLNVLMIGDSNTEIGHIFGSLARIFEERYGYFGSGYHSLHPTVGMGSGYLNGPPVPMGDDRDDALAFSAEQWQRFSLALMLGAAMDALTATTDATCGKEKMTSNGHSHEDHD